MKNRFDIGDTVQVIGRNYPCKVIDIEEYTTGFGNRRYRYLISWKIRIKGYSKFKIVSRWMNQNRLEYSKTHKPQKIGIITRIIKIIQQHF